MPLNPTPVKNLLEIPMEFLIHEVIDERVDATVEKPEPVNEQHRKEEVRVLQEAPGLDLADEGDDIERGPGHNERNGHHHHHPRHLQIEKNESSRSCVMARRKLQLLLQMQSTVH